MIRRRLPDLASPPGLRSRLKVISRHLSERNIFFPDILMKFYSRSTE